MSNNLKILYNNLVDLSTTTITASTGNTGIDNLKSDFKSVIWSTGNASSTITVTFSQDHTIDSVVLAFTNLTATATISVEAQDQDSNILQSTGPLLVCPGTQPTEVFGQALTGSRVSLFKFGLGFYSRCYIPEISCRKVVLYITNSEALIEISRLIIGKSWSPRYNMPYGLNSGFQDSSEHTRTESGDLITYLKSKYRTMSFDLKYLPDIDRTSFRDILYRGAGNPMFVSLFPNDSDPNREQNHMIYGKIPQLSSIQYNMLDLYSTSISMEEV